MEVFERSEVGITPRHTESVPPMSSANLVRVLELSMRRFTIESVTKF